MTGKLHEVKYKTIGFMGTQDPLPNTVSTTTIQTKTPTSVPADLSQRIETNIDKLKLLGTKEDSYIASIIGESASKEFIVQQVQKLIAQQTKAFSKQPQLTEEQQKELQTELLEESITLFLDLDVPEAKTWMHRPEEKKNRADIMAVVSIPSHKNIFKRHTLIFIVIEAKGLYPAQQLQGYVTNKENDINASPITKAPKQAYTIGKNLCQVLMTTKDVTNRASLQDKIFAVRESIVLGLREQLGKRPATKENTTAGMKHIKALIMYLQNQMRTTLRLRQQRLFCRITCVIERGFEGKDISYREREANSRTITHRT